MAQELRILGERFDLLDIAVETRYRSKMERVEGMVRGLMRIECNYLGIWRKDWRFALVKKIS